MLVEILEYSLKLTRNFNVQDQDIIGNSKESLALLINLYSINIRCYFCVLRCESLELAASETTVP